MAWLTAIPRTKPSRGPEIKYPARIESYRKNDAEPPLPPVTAPHIFDWLMEVGPTEPTDMGRRPISWQTIAAWQRLTFTRLTAWEARQLRRLSTVFLGESQEAESPQRPAPWIAVGAAVDHAANERQLRAVLG